MHIVGMIFAAGKGSRLGALGKTLPKAMIEIQGQSMLKRIILQMKAAGIQEIVINLYHLGEKIRAYLQDENYFGVKVHFSEEDVLLDTGGGLKKAVPLFGEADVVLVHNCDVYCSIELGALVETHLKNKATASLVVSDRDTNRVLCFDAANRLSGWKNKQSGEQILLGDCHKEMAYGGIQVCSRAFFPFLEELGDRFWLFDAYFNAVRAESVIEAIDIGDTLWWDIGTPEKICELEELLESGSKNT